MKKSDKSIGLRIRAVRSRLGFNQTGFGRLFGVTQEAVSGWENGAYPDALCLLEIVKRGGVTIEWLLTGVPGQGYALCPLLNDRAASGPPKTIEDQDISESLWIPSRTGGENTYLMRVREEAMEPIFKKGDLLGIQECLQDAVMLAGEIVAAWLPKEGLIARWLSDDGGCWVLRPQGRGYPLFFIEKKDAVPLFKVLCWCSKQGSQEIAPS